MSEKTMRFAILALPIGLFAEVAAEDSYQLQTEEAVWESGDSLLVAKGRVSGKTGVTITDADKLATIGQLISSCHRPASPSAWPCSLCSASRNNAI